MLYKSFLLIYTELKKGLRSAWPYFFSHHIKEQRDRCYLFDKFLPDIYFCSRCVGIYGGIIFGFSVSFFYIPDLIQLLFIIIIFPLPTILDWFLFVRGIYYGYNILRSFFGFLLGIAYVYGLIGFLSTYNFLILSTGIFYFFIVGLTMYFFIDRK